MASKWHTKNLKEIFTELSSNEQGLNSGQVVLNREKYGPNVLPEAKTDGLLKIFLRQFQSPLIYILAAAGVVILFMNERTDAAIIFFILVFNSIIGTLQEGKAQNALNSLKHMVETKASVLRAALEEIIPDTEVVAGDILVLHEGDKVAADSRVISANNLTVAEAALTGESEPVYKTNEVLNVVNLPTAEQKNMLFKGTNIVAGTGTAVAVLTGSNTVIGKISERLATIESIDPIKRDISKLSRVIIIITVSICSVIFLAGLAAGNSAKQMFATVISLSVSIIPEGLPVVLTLVLATGVWRMSKSNVLVKKLQAVESLGQATVIAVDKTGTITKNELTVTKVYVDNKIYDVEGSGYEPKGRILLNGAVVGQEATGISRVAKSAASCSGAYVAYLPEKKIWQVSGDPTEAALITFAEKLGFNKEKLQSENPQIAEIPFAYKTKYHAVLNKAGTQSILSVVGAPESVLALCTSIRQEKKNIHLSENEKRELEDVIRNFSQQGLRVLAIAGKSLESPNLKTEELRGLNFIGFIGMKDVLRPESTEALTRAKAAGIKVVMITGDHKLTAQAIATEAGIYTDNSRVIEGVDIEKMNQVELSKIISEASVFARVTPEHKLRIIEAYKSNGEIIAMTGDGVNDAPSLVAADLGVAMGKIGTEVAKEAADIILLDDNFGNIITAVEEGRSIYKTIKKVILYLFSTGLGEVAVIAGAIFMGLPLPLLPAHIIWLNFVTDGFLTVALGMEPKEEGLLQEREKTKNSFIDRAMGIRMALMALTMGAGSLWVFTQYAGGSQVKAWTMTMTTLAVVQWFNAWNCRSDKKSIFQVSFWSNKYLIAATATVIALQLLAVYNPLLQKLLKTTALTFTEWLIALAVASSVIVIEELRKTIARSSRFRRA